jgi:hypothetical protein
MGELFCDAGEFFTFLFFVKGVDDAGEDSSLIVAGKFFFSEGEKLG